MPLARTSSGGGRRLGVGEEEHRTILRAGLARWRPGSIWHMGHDGPTQFSELNDVLDSLVDAATAILGTNIVGVYLVGSFAVGDADIHSDCDFLIPTYRRLDSAEETELRKLHREIPERAGYWNRHLEGSYPPVEDLRTVKALGRRWLFVDHGHQEMEWSTHCNSLEHRWSLRHCGAVLVGPPPETFVEELPKGALAEKMRRDIPEFMDALRTWITVEDIAWAQRYAVTTLCRMLYTMQFDAVTSKRKALEWAQGNLEAEWKPLIDSALSGRAKGWDPNDVPAPELIELTYDFAEYAKNRAA